jgi:hypothetical protein
MGPSCIFPGSATCIASIWGVSKIGSQWYVLIEEQLSACTIIDRYATGRFLLGNEAEINFKKWD